MNTNSALTLGCVVLVAFLFTGEGVAVLTDLPIGHFKLNERPDGTINVEARCVETTQILETLAQRTSKPIVFDKPCNTFTSFWNPKKWSPAEEWLDYIAGLSSNGILVCRSTNGKWKVSGLDRPGVFDPGLSGSEILARYKKAEVVATKSSDGIQSGALFLNGLFIEPPYKITTLDGGTGKSKVLVNGLLWTECSGFQVPRAEEQPSLPSSGQFAKGATLQDYVNRTLYPNLLAEGKTEEEAFREVAVFLRGQSIVDTVYLKEEDPGNRMFRIGPVLVKLKGHPMGTSVFDANLDLHTGVLGTGPAVNRTSLEHATEIADDLSKRLQARHLVIRGSNGALAVLKGGAANEFTNRLDDARSQRVEVAESLISETIDDRLIAREIAANLANAPAAMFAILRGLSLQTPN